MKHNTEFFNYTTYYQVLDQFGEPLNGVFIKENPQPIANPFEGYIYPDDGVTSTRATSEGVREGVFEDNIAIFTNAVQTYSRCTMQNTIKASYGDYPLTTIFTFQYFMCAKIVNDQSRW